MSEAVTYRTSDHVGTITLNRPAARNAVNHEFAVGMEAALDRIEGDPDTWVGLITANCEGPNDHPFSAPEPT